VTPDEIRKLLGGYATGTLTEEERNLLFSAALEDQELFDVLADEEPLRELLAEPATRQTLIEELQRQPVLDSWLLRDQRAPVELAAHAMPPVAPPVRAEMRNLAKPFWSRIWEYLTPRRLAMAGGLAMLLAIAGGIQYERLHAPGPATVATVNPAINGVPERSPSAVGEPAAPLSVRPKEPTRRQMPPGATPPRSDAQQEAARQVADARPSGGDRAEQKLAEANGVELDRAKQRTDESRAAVPPAVARDAVDSEKKTEKETADAGPAREQSNQAVIGQVAREQVAPARSKETVSTGSSAPPVATFSVPPPSSGKVTARRSSPASPAQIVVGGLSRAAAPPPPAAKAGLVGGQFREVDAKVTDVNGTIVSVNVGSNSGFKAGDTIEIVRDNRVIATSKLSQVGATFAVGSFQSAAGSTDPPRAGDVVRRAAASQPQR